MGIYIRQDSPYYWKRYDRDPVTGARRPNASTKIYRDAATKPQRDQNRRDAEYQFAQDLIDIRQAIVNPPAVAPTYRTFADWISAYYLGHYTAHHRGAAKERPMIERFVREFGTLALEDFTVRRVEVYRDARLQQVKVTTVNRETYVLVACVRRWATVMRADGCTTPDPRDLLAGLTRRTPKDTETRWFSEAEFDRFITALRSHATIAGIPRAEGLAMAYTAVETLLRLGSLLRLTWAYYRGTHLVPLNAKVKIAESPVTPHMQQLFAVLPTDTDRLFASFDRVATRAKRHGVILSEARRHAAAAGIADRWFAEVCRLAELPCGRDQHGVTFHSFRHTGATWLLNGSPTRPPVSVKTVMALGGWKNVRTFMNTYCHTDTQMVRAAASSLFPVVKPALVASDAPAS